MRRFTPFALLLVGALAVGFGCNKSDKQQGASASGSGKMAGGQNTLYNRLGGEKAIQAVVHSFVQRGAADPKVNFTRKGHPNEWDATPQNVAKLEKRLVEFIGMATGGPQKYQGRDMVTSHTGMKITEAEFNALAGHLIAALDEFKVPQKEKDELVAIVAGTKDQIVGK
jgi:hemoglobin